MIMDKSSILSQNKAQNGKSELLCKTTSTNLMSSTSWLWREPFNIVLMQDFLSFCFSCGELAPPSWKVKDKHLPIFKLKLTI